MFCSLIIRFTETFNHPVYGTAIQVTDDNIIWYMRFAFWISKATDLHSEHVLLVAFPQR
jgi:hypothetical protein